MREIEKMLIKKNFLENFYRQKRLEEETLMEIFGRDIVLQMSRKYSLYSQQPNLANETSVETLTTLHKGVQMTLGGPSIDYQDRREKMLGIHKEGSLPSQLHPEAKESTNPKMLLNYSPSQHPKATKESSKENPIVLHKGAQMPLMGGGSPFVSDTKGGLSLNDQDRREKRLGIHEEGDIPSQLNADRKENTQLKLLLKYSTSSEQPKETNKISDKALTVLHKGVQMTLIGGGSSFVSDIQGGPCIYNQDRHEEKLGIHEKSNLPFQLHPGRKENTKPKMGRGTSTLNQLKPKTPNISHSRVGFVGFATRTSTPLVNSAKECSPKTKENTDTPLVDGNDKTSCNLIKKKNWKCQLCHVMTNTKKVLEEHYRGKKHKKQEKAALESCVISPTIKEHVGINMEAKREDDLDKLGSAPSVLKKDETIPDEDAFGMKRKIAPTEEEQGNDTASFGHQNKKMKFWCQGCRYGTNTEANILNHRIGKEHMELMQMNGGTVIVEINEPDDVHYVEAGKLQELESAHDPKILSSSLAGQTDEKTGSADKIVYFT